MSGATDTLRTAETLRRAGVPERQATAHARAIDKAVGHLVTREDLNAAEARLEARFTRLEARVYRALLIQTGVITAAVIALLQLTS